MAYIQDQNLQELLEIYLRDYVTLVSLRRRQKHEATKQWTPVMDYILNEVEKKDPRFEMSKFFSGSYWEGVKIKAPDEFDIVLSLQKLEIHCKAFHPTVTVCYLKFPIGYISYIVGGRETEKWQYCINPQGLLLSAEKLLSRFAGLVQQVLIDKGKYINGFWIECEVNDPSVTLKLFTEPYRSENPRYAIDLVPAIRVNDWPDAADGWEARARDKGWPSEETIQKMRHNTYTYLVAKLYKGHHPLQEYLWQLGMKDAEKMLITSPDPGCRRNVLRVLKGLNIDLGWIGIKSFYLKTAVFWESEKFASSLEWTQDKLHVRVRSVVYWLKECISKKFCPHYFIPEWNLIEWMAPEDNNQMKIKFKNFLSHPEREVLTAIEYAERRGNTSVKNPEL